MQIRASADPSLVQSDDMQTEAIEVAQEAMDKFNIEKEIAHFIKRTVPSRPTRVLALSTNIPSVRRAKGRNLALYCRAELRQLRDAR